MEVFHLARSARAFFFARCFAQSISPVTKTKKANSLMSSPLFLCRALPLHYFSAARAALTAASTCSGAVPPGWLRLATEPSSVRYENTSSPIRCATFGSS